MRVRLSAGAAGSIPFSRSQHTTFDAPVPWGDLALGLASGACWTVVFLAGAVVLFRRRQF